MSRFQYQVRLDRNDIAGTNQVEDTLSMLQQVQVHSSRVKYSEIY
jgi:hypothetical protein